MERRKPRIVDPILAQAKTEAARILPKQLDPQEANQIWKDTWKHYIEQKRSESEEGIRTIGNVTFYGEPPTPTFWRTKI